MITFTDSLAPARAGTPPLGCLHPKKTPSEWVYS